MREAVAIKSVSAWPDSRPDCQKMIDWTQKKLEALGVVVEQADIGFQTLPDGSKLKLPNVILGVLGNVSKKTLNKNRQYRPQVLFYSQVEHLRLSYRINSLFNSCLDQHELINYSFYLLEA